MGAERERERLAVEEARRAEEEHLAAEASRRAEEQRLADEARARQEEEDRLARIAARRAEEQRQQAESERREQERRERDRREREENLPRPGWGYMTSDFDGSRYGRDYLRGRRGAHVELLACHNRHILRVTHFTVGCKLHWERQLR